VKRRPPGIVSASIVISFILTSSALGGRYDDFAAWAERDKASSRQLMLDMAFAKSAHELALALKASASRQHRITSELIEVVHHHPELRCLADLGLEDEAFQRWSRQHPDAAARRVQLPKEVLAVAARLHRYTELLESAPEVAARHDVMAKYRHDPEVAAAAEQLHVVLQDNERRLMNTF
jgi:phosphoribosyl-dephospho-CoA transferase